MLFLTKIFFAFCFQCLTFLTNCSNGRLQQLPLDDLNKFLVDINCLPRPQASEQEYFFSNFGSLDCDEPYETASNEKQFAENPFYVQWNNLEDAELNARLQELEINTENGRWPQSGARSLLNRIVSYFDELEYSVARGHDYCEIGVPCRGHTAGMAGFLSTDGSALTVFRHYRAKYGDPRMQRYEEFLDLYSGGRESSDESYALYADQFCCVWNYASQNLANFARAQEQVRDAAYYVPAMRVADHVSESLKAKIGPLTRMLLYMVTLQYGSQKKKEAQHLAAEPARIDNQKWSVEKIALRVLDTMKSTRGARSLVREISEETFYKLGLAVLGRLLVDQYGNRAKMEVFDFPSEFGSGRDSDDGDFNEQDDSFGPANIYDAEKEVFHTMPAQSRLYCLQQFSEQNAWHLNATIRCQTDEIDLYF